MSILTPSDFVGRFLITKNANNVTNIQTIIDETEFSIMNELLGAELYALYLAGVTVNDPIYLKLRDKFFESDSCGRHTKSLGVVRMLLGFTYFDYYQTDGITASLNGQQSTLSENSEKVSVIMANNQIYNDSVYTFINIQSYIRENLEVYPTFKGIKGKLLAN